MGRTDIMDNNISCYRIGIHSKKLYWPIFTYLLDVAIQNAWTLYRKSGRKITQLKFRRNIYQTYLTRYQVASKAPGKMPRAPGNDDRVSSDKRYDGLKEEDVVVLTTVTAEVIQCAASIRLDYALTVFATSTLKLRVFTFKIIKHFLAISLEEPPRDPKWEHYFLSIFM